MTELKKTFITTFRGDLIDIATIARWMVSSGITPRSRNELINCAVVNFAAQLRKMCPESSIVETGDALEYLSELGLIGKNLEKMAPALAKDFWQSATPSAGVNVSNELELTTKAKKASNDQLADDVTKLMDLADERIERDRKNAKQLSQVAHLPIAKEEN